jgi:anti-anti-sigma factor
MNMTNRRPVIVKHLPEKLSLEQANAFFCEVEPLLRIDRPRIVFDFSNVLLLDSAGVQILLLCLEEVMKRNGDVKLAAIPPGPAKILELTEVDCLFENFENTADAVESFHRIPEYPFQQVSQPLYSTPAPERAA